MSTLLGVAVVAPLAKRPPAVDGVVADIEERARADEHSSAAAAIRERKGYEKEALFVLFLKLSWSRCELCFFKSEQTEERESLSSRLALPPFFTKFFLSFGRC